MLGVESMHGSSQFLSRSNLHFSSCYNPQNAELKDKLRAEIDANLKFKKSESDLKKAQAVAEHSIKELNDKYRILVETKV